MIPQEKIEEIKDASDIVDVVGNYVALKKAGVNYKGICPFHQEKTPSFIVSPVKQIWHCFGSCGEGGNVFGFIQKIENLSFIESVEFLAKRAGITITYDGKRTDYKKAYKDRLFELNRQAVEFFREALRKNQQAAEYLKKRGITEGVIEEFSLGYAPQGNLLYSKLKAAGHDDQVILKSWLCVKNEGGIRDAFHGRLIFPIFDVYGEPVAFGARVLDNSLPKYINSSETDVYVKGKNLYNLNNARKQKSDSLILTEGYMDAIAVYAAGIKNVAAVLGTSLTENQARLAGRYFEKVTVMFDADEAGINGAARAGEILFAEGLDVRVCVLDAAKDPDEFIAKQGVEALKQKIEAAKPFIEFKLGYLRGKGDMNSPYYKEKVIKEMAALLEKQDNAVLRAEAVRKIASAVMVQESIVEQYVKAPESAKQEIKHAPALPAKPSGMKARGIELAEKGILESALASLERDDETVVLRHLVNRRRIMEVEYADFMNRLYAEILEKIEKYHEENEKEKLKKLEIQYVDNAQAGSLLSEALAREERIKDSDYLLQVINDCFLKIRKEKALQRVAAVQEELKRAEAEGRNDEVARLLKEKQDLQKIIQHRGEDLG